MGREEFLQQFGAIYESSPWVAEAAWEGRPPDLEAVRRELAAAVDHSSDQRKLALIRAHPDLAGRAARAGTLTQSSTREQTGAGLDQCSDEEYEAFQQLNQAYHEKFGFPFVIAVSGLDRRQILAAFRTRLENDRDREFKTALQQIHRIAAIRLEAWSNG
ncbi:MAG: 2-oxo-4-hydroxy-4-carboxy-5-ureidoimidazoline decarboxylase [Xanthomonadales bacterium]|nr:2-oxo-4-hydroxy-4-carboxy-5-ureidoimidazoline decarboxylase [Xanthomonadales bacterium]